jgi:hypothetical protein
MDLKCINKTNVFADWLDVTCSPDDSFVDSVIYALDSFGAYIRDLNDSGQISYTLGKGSIRIYQTKRFHKVGISGAALEAIRELNKLDYFLSCISENPHSITRLDASLDTDQDGANVYEHFEKRFSNPSKFPRLSRKVVTPSYISSRRTSDGRVTGTVNIGGYKNTKVSARIYDKQAESLSRGVDIPPRTRYELTVRKDMNPSLRDVSDPTAIFWHYMGNTVLKRPSDAPVWSSGWGGAWNMVIEKPLVYQVVKTKIENNPELLRIFELASMMSANGRLEALNMIKRKHVDIDVKKLKHTA